MSHDIRRGDTASFTTTIKQRGGGAYPLGGCTVWVVAKANAAVPDSGALYTRKLVVNADGTVAESSGLALGGGGAAAGVVVETVTAEESALFRPGAYLVDVQIRTPSGTVYTPIADQRLTVKADVAQETA